MRNKIIAFKRIDDNELFSLNDDNETYSNHFSKVRFPDNLHHKYEAVALSNTRYFEPIVI